MINVVIDTNILISGLLFGGKPNYIVQLVMYQKIKAYISPVLIAELLDVLIKKFVFSIDRLQVVEKK